MIVRMTHLKVLAANLQMIEKKFISYYLLANHFSPRLPLPKKFMDMVDYQKDGKMSKSKGNAIYPEDLTKGLDAFRYYLLKGSVCR